MPPGTVVAIGRRAAEVLGHGGPARVLAPLAASTYVVVGDEILWLGPPNAALHPRAILLSPPALAATGATGDTLAVPPSRVPPWSPAPATVDARAAAALQRGAPRLGATAAMLGRPEGFGAQLVHGALAFPLAGAGGRAGDLAAACARDAPARAAEIAITLLGLGSGLTPSGDDFVGGAFFARAILARAGGCDIAGWQEAAATVREAATRLTHPISAALIGDLVAGESWAPLHALAEALAREDLTAAGDAARRLIGLGRSSGWDLLAGFIAGAGR